MHVGLDLLFLTGHSGGVETYVRELVPALRRVQPSLRITGFVSPGHRAPAWLKDVDVVSTGLPGPVPVAMPFGHVTRFPIAVRRTKVDVVHCPANFATLLPGVPLVVTVHDLLHRRHPRLVPPWTRVGVRVLVDEPARRATRVITVSEASAADIVRYLGRPRDDIDVTPPAATIPAGRGSPGDHAVWRDNGGRPQLISVGNTKPHKNLAGLVRALALIDVDQRPGLVLPGRGIDRLLLPLVRKFGLERDVVMPGWVSDEALEHLYAHSVGYLCPSLFEGFGLPVLEAMQRGVAVACSDIPVLREVAGDAALYFDPAEESSVAAAMRRLAHEPDLRAGLAARGRVRASVFSWDRTARLTIESYERALASWRAAHRVGR